MTFLNILIKPVSSNCNMNCNYCFYKEEAKNRLIYSYGTMSSEITRILVKHVLQTPYTECNFMFQGGEPTLAGISYFEEFITFIQQYNTHHIPIHLSIQTNGLTLDKQWAAFFAKHHFLVGISLDGTKDIHNLYRLDSFNKETYNRILKNIYLLQRYHVSYNLLTVLTAQAASHIHKIYQFYKKNQFCYQQYIPCLDPITQERGQEIYSLSPELFEKALKNLFDLWYTDLCQNRYIYIRQFENWISMLKGNHPEACSMYGRCTIQYIIEANGDIFPCDFYVTDKNRLGNITEVTLEDIIKTTKMSQFLEASYSISPECNHCKWYPLCRGGCRRDRDFNGEIKLNYYCLAYQNFFSYTIERMEQLVRYF